MTKQLSAFLGAAARKARLARGLTQEDVADLLGISAQFYSRIERGRAMPSVPTLVRMTAVLGVRADWLLGEPSNAGPAAGKGRLEGKASPLPGDAPAGTQQPARDDEREGGIEKPAVRRIVRRLAKSSPRTVRMVSLVLDAVDGPEVSEVE